MPPAGYLSGGWIAAAVLLAVRTRGEGMPLRPPGRCLGGFVVVNAGLWGILGAARTDE